MKKLLLLFLLLFHVFSFGQQQKIDSLKRVCISLKDDNKKLQVLNQLTILIKNFGAPADEQLKFYTEMFELSRQLENYEFEALSLKYLSMYYLRKENFNLSEKYALMSKNIGLEQHDHFIILKANGQLGVVYNHFDKYDKAIASYHKTIIGYKEKLTDEQKEENKRLLGIIYTNLSTAYRNNHQDSLSIVYDIKSFEWAEKNNDYMRKSLFYTKIGWYFNVLEQYELAEKSFKKALKDSSKIYVKVYNISAHHGLGYNYYKWKKFDKALYHDSIALEFFKKTDNRIFVQGILNNIADIYVEKNLLDKAMIINTEADSIAKDINNLRAIGNVKLTFAKIDLLRGNNIGAEKLLLNVYNSSIRRKLSKGGKKILYSLLVNVYENTKQYKKAFEFTKLRKEVSEKILKSKLAKISRIDTKYQIEKNKKELAEQKEIITQKEFAQKKLNYLIAFLSLVVLGILGLLINYYRRFIKKQEELNKMFEKIKILQNELFQSKEQLPKEQGLALEKFNDFLKRKYQIQRDDLIDLWQNLAMGISQTEYARLKGKSQDTIKSQVTKLHLFLKNKSNNPNIERYTKVNAIIEYYQALRLYEFIMNKH